MKKTGIILSICWLLSSIAAFASTENTSFKVDTFPTMPITLMSCENMAGSGEATFDLNSAIDDIVILLPNMAVNWFEDAGLNAEISTPDAYVSPNAIVYAEIYSTVDTTIRVTEEATLIVLSTPDLSYLTSIPDTFCGFVPVRLGTVTGPDALYNWSPADFLSSDTVSNPIFTPDDQIENYTYTVTATSPDSQCSAMEMVAFIVLEAELEIEGPDTVELCKGMAETTITATSSENPQNITWMASRDTLSDLTGPTTTIDPEFSTTVIAMLEFENGCVLYDTVFLRVDSLPEFDISWIPDPRQPCNKYCPGDIVTLVTQAPDLACYPDIMHKWTPNSDIVGSDTTLNIAIATGNGPGKLYTRTTTNHACTEVDTHFVDVVDTIIDINGLPATRLCRGFTFELMIDDSDWPDLTEVNWSVQDGKEGDISLSCTDCQTTTVTIDDEAMAGTVNILVTGVKELCCDASGSVDVVIQIPPVPIQPLTVCVGGDGQITSDPAYTDFMWEVRTPGVGIDDNGIFNPTVSNIPSGGAILDVTAIAPDGCFSRSTFNVADTVATGPAIDAPTDLCVGGVGQLLADPTFTDWNWTATGGSIDPDNVFNPEITVTDPNGATFTVQATDANGCETSATVQVGSFVINAPLVQVPFVCPDEGTGVINADPLFSYEWFPMDGASVNPNTGANPTVSNVPVGGARIDFDAINAEGCMVSSTVVVPTFGEDDLTLVNVDSVVVVTQGSTIEFMAESDPPANADQFVWTQNGNVIQTGGATVAVLITEGENNICVEFTNSNGCLQTECEIVTGIELDVFIPNAFAPSDNMREENTRFQPLDRSRFPLDAALITDFKVFNRWGQKVYDNDSNDTGWDGRQDGELAPSDVYLYIIEITTEDGESNTFTGDVSLIR